MLWPLTCDVCSLTVTFGIWLSIRFYLTFHMWFLIPEDCPMISDKWSLTYFLKLFTSDLLPLIYDLMTLLFKNMDPKIYLTKYFLYSLISYFLPLIYHIYLWPWNFKYDLRRMSSHLWPLLPQLSFSNIFDLTISTHFSIYT